MQIFRSILIKTFSGTMQRTYTRGFLQGRSLISSLHGTSTTPLIALPCFHLLNCQRLLQIVWIPQWYFVTYATRSINIGTFKMFKQSFKIFKPEVLKPQVLEDETKLYSKNFVIPISYIKSCLKLCLY